MPLHQSPRRTYGANVLQDRRKRNFEGRGGERHLGINAFVYTVATLWEMKQTSHHIERCVHPRPEERKLTLVTPPSIDKAA